MGRSKFSSSTVGCDIVDHNPHILVKESGKCTSTKQQTYVTKNNYFQLVKFEQVPLPYSPYTY